MKRRMSAMMMLFYVLLTLTLSVQGSIDVSPVINGTATQPVLQSNGTLLEAIDFGDTADTVLDGIPFDGWSPAISGDVYTGANLTVTVTNGYGGNFSSYTGLGSAPVWKSENYVSNANGPITTLISGLDAGRLYRIQYMNYDGRNGQYVYSVPLVTLQDSTGASVDVDYNFGGLADAFGLLTATVTGATSFTIIMPAGSSGKSTQLDGLVIHEITGYATNPVPVDGQGLATDPTSPLFDKVEISQNVSWTGPSSTAIDPGYPVNYRLYLDPNVVKVQDGAANCTYFQDYSANTMFDPPSDLVNGATYYWRVDVKLKFVDQSDPNELTGLIWSFKTKPLNNPAMIDAGPSLITWLEASQTGIVLDRSSLIYPVEGDESFAWSCVSGIIPGFMESASDYVSFDDSGALHPKVFITQTGTFTLKVMGSDGENPDQSDLMQFRVYANACEAARNNPAMPYEKLEFDFDNDCIESLSDFTLLATEWLTYNYLEENVYFNPILAEKDLSLWLDAADTSSLVIDPNTGEVTRWNDKSGNGYYLIAGGTAGNPLYVADALNSRGIVDFGPATANASSKWMQFKNPADDSNLNISNIRTVFWVMKGGNFLLGDDNTYHFHRGVSETAADGYIWSGSYSSGNIRNGSTYLNGELIDGTTTRLPVDYSQISLVTVGNIESSRLCSDRTYRSGGQQIAEILIFNRPLFDQERLEVEAYLKAKWGTP